MEWKWRIDKEEFCWVQKEISRCCAVWHYPKPLFGCWWWWSDKVLGYGEYQCPHKHRCRWGVAGYFCLWLFFFLWNTSAFNCYLIMLIATDSSSPEIQQGRESSRCFHSRQWIQDTCKCCWSQIIESSWNSIFWSIEITYGICCYQGYIDFF